MSASLFEGAELVSETGKIYLAVSSLGQSNVWTAAEKDNFSNIVVLKAPSEDDVPGSWPKFCHELVMHELFKPHSAHIRKLVDRIPPKDGEPPLLVLEIAEMTLWTARTKRPLSRGEIVAVVRGVLQGLEAIHDQGLVYGDLKMENVMLSGFDVDVPGDGSNLEVKLGDLGTVMYPASGTMQPIAYRAPEVYFKEEITPAADIWSLGLVYSHLVEAQNNFSEAGIYDDLTGSSSSMDQRTHAVRKQISKDYDLRNTSYYRGCALPSRTEKPTQGNIWEQRGLDARDVNFLQRVMKADPRERPTARAILASYWIKGGGLEDKGEKKRSNSAGFDGTIEIVSKASEAASPRASYSSKREGSEGTPSSGKPRLDSGGALDDKPESTPLEIGNLDGTADLEKASEEMTASPKVSLRAPDIPLPSRVRTQTGLARKESRKRRSDNVEPDNDPPLKKWEGLQTGGKALTGGTYLSYR